MKKVRYFFDIDKEIHWLNLQAAQGLRLIKKEYFTYYFEACEKGIYSYQVEKQHPSEYPDLESYVNFIHEFNIHPVASQWGWIYLEKKNDGQEFHIFSDAASKIAHYRALIFALIWIAVFGLLMIYGNLNPSILSESSNVIGAHGPYFFNISISLLSGFIIVLKSFTTILKYISKIMNLKREQIFYE